MNIQIRAVQLLLLYLLLELFCLFHKLSNYDSMHMLDYHTCYVPLLFGISWFVYVYFVIKLVIEYFPQNVKGELCN